MLGPRKTEPVHVLIPVRATRAGTGHRQLSDFSIWQRGPLDEQKPVAQALAARSHGLFAVSKRSPGEK